MSPCFHIFLISDDEDLHSRLLLILNDLQALKPFCIQVVSEEEVEKSEKEIEKYITMGWDLVLVDHPLRGGERLELMVINIARSRQIPWIAIGKELNVTTLSAYTDLGVMGVINKDEIELLGDIVKAQLQKSGYKPIIIVEDRTFSVIDANELAVEFLGYTYDELLGTEISSLMDLEIGPEKLSEAGKDMPKVEWLRSGKRTDVKVLKKDNGIWIIEIIETPIDRLSGRGYTKIELSPRELTAIKPVLSGLSHYFNNTLSVIMQFPGMVSKVAAENQEIKTWADKIGEITRKDAEKLRTFAEFSGERGPDNGEVNLNETIHEIIEAIGTTELIPGYDTENYSIELKLQPNISVLSGNKTELYTLLLNLLKNSVEAMPTTGRISILTMEISETIILEIRDTGVGLAPKEVELCWHPFYSTKNDRYRGSGLFTVYGIVLRHSAEMAIKSTPRQGTSVRIAFPTAVDISS